MLIEESLKGLEIKITDEVIAELNKIYPPAEEITAV